MVHGTQSSTRSTPVLLLYVPAGQGNSLPRLVPLKKEKPNDLLVSTFCKLQKMVSLVERVPVYRVCRGWGCQDSNVGSAQNLVSVQMIMSQTNLAEALFYPVQTFWD